MICHLEVAIWQSGTSLEIASGAARRKVSRSRMQPTTCLRRLFESGGGVVTYRPTAVQQLQRKWSYAIVVKGFFFSFFSLRYSLKLWSRGLRLPTSGCSFCVATSHERCNKGAGGCFKFNVLYSRLLENFTTQWGSCPSTAFNWRIKSAKIRSSGQIGRRHSLFSASLHSRLTLIPESQRQSYFDVFCISYSQHQLSLASKSCSFYHSFSSSLCSTTMIVWLLSRCSAAVAVGGVLQFGTVNSWLTA